MDNNRLLLAGCGILHKEIRWLIDKNNWPLDTFFLNSALHINFEKLSEQLTKAFATHRGREIVIFYGACHPLMEGILKKGNTFRTEGQNCVDILLGNALFSEELAKGAFFLLEDWARRWEYITSETFGTNIELTREIFQGDRKYLLCLKTPCSRDFSAEAEAAGALVGVPIRWMEVGLEHLESVMQDAIDRKMRELEWRK
jgi:Protein of unknown function (DUF1638)